MWQVFCRLKINILLNNIFSVLQWPHASPQLYYLLCTFLPPPLARSIEVSSMQFIRLYASSRCSACFFTHVACARVGFVTSGIVFVTFLVTTICSMPELYAWAERLTDEHRVRFDPLHTRARCAAFFVWFCAIFAETICLCFASRRSEPINYASNASPELNCSFLSRITLW